MAIFSRAHDMLKYGGIFTHGSYFSEKYVIDYFTNIEDNIETSPQYVSLSINLGLGSAATGLLVSPTCLIKTESRHLSMMLFG